jgi:hypothetical protein
LTGGTLTGNLNLNLENPPGTATAFAPQVVWSRNGDSHFYISGQTNGNTGYGDYGGFIAKAFRGSHGWHTVMELVGAQTTPILTICGLNLTGPLTLQADPANPLQAATKQYVDAGISTIALTPGPEGPVGPAGPQGPAGTPAPTPPALVIGGGDATPCFVYTWSGSIDITVVINPGMTADVPVSVTGIEGSDNVFWNPSDLPAGLILSHCHADDGVINIRLLNATAAAITPGTISGRFTISRLNL